MDLSDLPKIGEPGSAAPFQLERLKGCLDQIHDFQELIV